MNADAKLFHVSGRRVYTLETNRTQGVKDYDWTYDTWGDDLDSTRTRVEENAGSSPGGKYADVITYVAQADDSEVERMRQRVKDYAFGDGCCDLAIFQPCVCSYSTICPVHGRVCHGTHD